MKRFKTFVEQMAGSKCSCCGNMIDQEGKCGCGPDCEHCGGQHDMSEAARRKGAPKMTGDSIAIQRAKDAEHNKAMGRTKTGRKKPARQMTSTQRSLAQLRGEETELDEAMDQKKFSAGAKAVKAYAQKNGGVDKKDFMEVSKLLDQIGRVNILQAGQLLSRLNRLVDGMDTDVRERIFVELKKVGLVEQAELDERKLDASDFEAEDPPKGIDFDTKNLRKVKWNLYDNGTIKDIIKRADSSADDSGSDGRGNSSRSYYMTIIKAAKAELKKRGIK